VARRIAFCDKCELLGVPFARIDMERVIETTLRWTRERRSAYVCAVNASGIQNSRRDPAFAEALRSADLTLPDGAPVAWGVSALGVRGQERVTGPSTMLSVLEAAERHGLRVLLYGSTDEILDVLSARLVARYPGLQLVGTISPPFRALTPDEDEHMIEKINDLRPDVTFVALGSPKQEKWMLAHRGRVRSVMFGVGAAFEYNAGLLRRAPQLVQTMGLEWVSRLAQQPQKMFVIYARTLPAFALRLTWQIGRTWLQPMGPSGGNRASK